MSLILRTIQSQLGLSLLAFSLDSMCRASWHARADIHIYIYICTSMLRA